MNTNNNINIIPILSYSNAENDKTILKDSIGKSGVYRWTNNLTGKFLHRKRCKIK